MLWRTAGLGLGAILSGVKTISDECFLVSARSLSEQATADDLKAGCLFPALENIRTVSAKVRSPVDIVLGGMQRSNFALFLQVAAAVAEYAWSSGVASGDKPADMLSHALANMWDPVYPQTASAL